jgi:hypothetical protein
LTGQIIGGINMSTLDALEVLPYGAGAEWGDAQGLFARGLQKQGSNRHEGLFEFYWRSSRLEGTGADDTSALPDPDFNSIQPVLQFTGPIVPDKMWYRASYEGRDRESPVNVLSGVAVQTVESQTFDVQLTWQASPRNKLAFNYRSDPLDANNLGISNLTPPSAALERSRDSETFSLNWTAPYSPKVLIENTLAWTEISPSQGPTSSNVPNDCVDSASSDFLNAAQCINLESGARSGSYFRVDRDYRQRLSVRGKATVLGPKCLGMRHRFVVGVDVFNERYFRDLTRGPSMAYYNVDRPAEDPNDPDASPESFGVALVRLAVPESDDVRTTSTKWAVYAEDQLKPAQNLTVTLGLRVDRQEIAAEGRSPFSPSDEFQAYRTAVAEQTANGVDDGSLWPAYFTAYEGLDAYEQQLQAVVCGDAAPDVIGNCLTDVSESILAQNQRQLHQVRRSDPIDLNNTNLSPRLSVAWSPGQSGKNAIRASYGRYFNRIDLLIPLQELEPAYTDLTYRVDQETGTPKLESGITPTVNVLTVDRDLETPYQDEFALSFERELWAETSLSLTYVSRKYRDQIQDVNVNLDTGDFGRCRLVTQPSQLPILPSPGSGQELIDPLDGSTYVDTDPGPGDGRLDDCVGKGTTLDLDPTSDSSDDPFASDILRVQRPDGVADLYLQNPFWGDVLLIGNYNEIDYEGVTVNIVRRQYRSWEMNGSYTWSRAVGDGEDYFQELGDDPSLRDSVKGFQSYDQTHVVKVNATTVTPWGVRLGTSVQWNSGLPYSIVTEQLSQDTLPPDTATFGIASERRRQTYVTGERNDQRNASFWNVDLKATKELRLGRQLNLQVSAEIFNLLDDNTYQIYNPFQQRGVQLNGSNEAQRRFGREWQVGMKLAF